MSVPGDRFEREADAMAARVAESPPGPTLASGTADASALRLQAARAPSGAAPGHSGGAGLPPLVRSALHSAGEPLAPDARDALEPRFGSDFGGVRVHTGATAAAAAASVGARAFTVGADVVFAADEYSPGTGEGRRLLAHELTHVVQQGAAPSTETAPVQRAPAGIQRDLPPVDPEIANLPGTAYLDAFTEAYYDLDYRAEGGNLSTWLTLEYTDGTLIDVNIYEFVEMSMAPDEVSAAMRQGYVGVGGRIFPAQLTPQTAPRLWAAREAAIEAMEQYNLEFMLTVMPVVIFFIGMTGSATMATGGAAPSATTRTASAAARMRLRSRQPPPNQTGGGAAAAAPPPPRLGRPRRRSGRGRTPPGWPAARRSWAASAPASARTRSPR
ncbi:MAG: DUF4157 domain-containing protein [Gemmatimonadota bacterium]